MIILNGNTNRVRKNPILAFPNHAEKQKQLDLYLNAKPVYSHNVYGNSYLNKLKSVNFSSVIALYLMNEVSGTAMVDRSQYATNASYSGVTVGAAPFLNGDPAPSFDGVNDSCNINTATVSANMNFNVFTMFAWAKVRSSSVWTDGTLRQIMRFRTNNDFSDQAYIGKSATNNTVIYRRQTTTPGNITYSLGSISTLDWFSVALVCTGTGSGNSVRAFFNGELVNAGSSPTSMPGTSVNQFWVGSQNGTTGNPWNGNIDNVLLANSAFSDADIKSLHNFL